MGERATMPAATEASRIESAWGIGVSATLAAGLPSPHSGSRLHAVHGVFDPGEHHAAPPYLRFFTASVVF